MKIGILTYHRTWNYGGCLQALATRLALENFGHEVYYVDYWPSYHRDSYSLFAWDNVIRAESIRDAVRYVYNSIRLYPYQKVRKRHFQTFLNKYIIPYCKPLEEEYDTILYGSDQIWRKQPRINDYNPVYFANNNFITKHHIAFSASMGVIPNNQKESMRISDLVSHFDRIAVRESELKDYLIKLGYNDTLLTIDPTLLLSPQQWDEYLSIPRYFGPKYILIYALNESFDMNEIYYFAKKKGLIVKVLYGSAIHADSENEITTAGPSEFIKLIKNAEYVFSSSFHGLVFSLIYQKEVFVSFKSNATRVKSLLSKAGIPERFLKPYSKIPLEFDSIDYIVVNKNLSSLRQSSLNYLKLI